MPEIPKRKRRNNRVRTSISGKLPSQPQEQYQSWSSVLEQARLKPTSKPLPSIATSGANNLSPFEIPSQKTKINILRTIRSTCIVLQRCTGPLGCRFSNPSRCENVFLGVHLQCIGGIIRGRWILTGSMKSKKTRLTINGKTSYPHHARK